MKKEQLTEDDLDRAYKSGIRVGLETGVRLLRKEAAQAFTDRKDDLARFLRGRADDLEGFIDKDEPGGR